MKRNGPAGLWCHRRGTSGRMAHDQKALQAPVISQVTISTTLRYNSLRTLAACTTAYAGEYVVSGGYYENEESPIDSWGDFEIDFLSQKTSLGVAFTGADALFRTQWFYRAFVVAAGRTHKAFIKRLQEDAVDENERGIY